MKKSDIKIAIEKRLADLGVPATHYVIRSIPSRVEVEAVVGGERLVVSCQSGLPDAEVERKIGFLEGLVLNHRDQANLVHATEAAE